MLRDIDFKAVYRSDEDNILADFYVPSLKASFTYDRAVGFFSSSMLSYAAQGVAALVESGGKMRLVVGGEITQDEHDAILNGYDLRAVQERVGSFFCKTVDQIVEELSFARLQTLAWMIGNGSLSVKVALTRQGMYHEKIGIFRDHTGNRIVFQGSANETVNALLPDYNFESINVFPSWKEELAAHSQPYVAGFERLWSNTTRNTAVIEFPEAARLRLIQIAKKIKQAPSSTIELGVWSALIGPAQDFSRDPNSVPKLPRFLGGQEFHIKEHQRSALRSWAAQPFKGILALATGAGKTITALYGATKLFEKMERLFLIVAVPYTDLADQWVDEAAVFNMNAIPAYDSSTIWKEKLSDAVHLFNAGALDFVMVIVVNRTLQGEAFQGLVTKVDGRNLMFVGDECHRHRSAKMLSALPDQAIYRLGLSATPEDPYLQSGMADPLESYYGSICARYSLAQALADEVLTPYEYNLVSVELTADETEQYIEISDEIAKRAAIATMNADGTSDDSHMEMLLFQRARIIGSAKNKLLALRSLLAKQEPRPLTLFYCGDGSVEDEADGQTIRQIEAVSRLLGELNWRSSRFTSRESKGVRTQILDDFKIGEIDGLVAIRCLDEGINIPGCHTAYLLASSRNPRQFIQRRGRILRRSPGKERALIFDFVVNLPASVVADNRHERSLFKAELERIAEFAGLCLNYAQAYRQIEDLLKRHDLVHEFREKDFHQQTKILNTGTNGEQYDGNIE